MTDELEPEMLKLYDVSEFSYSGIFPENLLSAALCHRSDFTDHKIPTLFLLQLSGKNGIHIFDDGNSDQPKNLFIMALKIVQQQIRVLTHMQPFQTTEIQRIHRGGRGASVKRSPVSVFIKLHIACVKD